MRILMLILSFLTGNAYSGEDHSFDTYRAEAESLLSISLIEGNHCKSQQDCISKQIILYSPASSGFCIHSYGISNIDTINRMIASILSLSKKMPQGSSICFSANTDTKQISLQRHFWEKERAFLTLNRKQFNTNH